MRTGTHLESTAARRSAKSRTEAGGLVAFGRRRRRRSTEDESPVEEGKRGNGCAGRVGVGREDDDDEIVVGREDTGRVYCR
jgi:hypothetical protein